MRRQVDYVKVSVYAKQNHTRVVTLTVVIRHGGNPALGVHVRLHHSRLNVDEPQSGILRLQEIHRAHERRLARAVAGEGGERAGVHERGGHVDEDRVVLARGFDEVPREDDAAEDVDFEAAPPVGQGRRRRERGGVGEEAGVGDEDVDRADAGGDLGEDGAHGGFVGDVGGKDVDRCFGPGGRAGFDFGLDGAEGSVFAACHDDVSRACCGKCLDYGPADPIATPGHEDGFAGC